MMEKIKSIQTSSGQHLTDFLLGYYAGRLNLHAWFCGSWRLRQIISHLRDLRRESHINRNLTSTNGRIFLFLILEVIFSDLNAIFFFFKYRNSMVNPRSTRLWSNLIEFFCNTKRKQSITRINLDIGRSTHQSTIICVVCSCFLLVFSCFIWIYLLWVVVPFQMAFFLMLSLRVS